MTTGLASATFSLHYHVGSSGPLTTGVTYIFFTLSSGEYLAHWPQASPTDFDIVIRSVFRTLTTYISSLFFIYIYIVCLVTLVHFSLFFHISYIFINQLFIFKFGDYVILTAFNTPSAQDSFILFCFWRACLELNTFRMNWIFLIILYLPSWFGAPHSLFIGLIPNTTCSGCHFTLVFFISRHVSI